MTRAMKLSLFSPTSVFSWFLILLLSLSPFAPEIRLQEPITTETETIEFTVQNAIGLSFDLHYYSIEKEENGTWVRIQPLNDTYPDLGYPIQLRLQKKVYQIDLIQTYGHLLAPGNYRIQVQQSYDNTSLYTSAAFTVTAA